VQQIYEPKHSGFPSLLPKRGTGFRNGGQPDMRSSIRPVR
jgi:hypothetical protein